jgi:hypothetical protein
MSKYKIEALWTADHYANRLTEAIRVARSVSQNNINKGRGSGNVLILKPKLDSNGNQAEWIVDVFICDNCKELCSDFGNGCCLPE